MSALKVCSKCREPKPREMFACDRSRRDGLQPTCRTCKRSYHVAGYTPEKGRAAYDRKRKTDLAGHRARSAAAMKKWRAANPERSKEIARNAARRQLAKRSAELNARRREKWAANPQLMRAKRRAYYAKKPDLIKGQVRRHREKYPGKVQERYRRWATANLDRKRAVNRAHYRSDSQRWRAYGAKRKAAKLRATPGWANLNAIAAFYANCPPGFQVDHVVPLQSKRVCGLHCEANLQYLTKEENASKYNRWWPEMPAARGDECLR